MKQNINEILEEFKKNYPQDTFAYNWLGRKLTQVVDSVPESKITPEKGDVAGLNHISDKLGISKKYVEGYSQAKFDNAMELEQWKSNFLCKDKYAVGEIHNCRCIGKCKLYE